MSFSSAPGNTLSAPPPWVVPDWPAPAIVRACMTGLAGGVSCGPFGPDGLNLGTGMDDPDAVARNRALLRRHLPGEPLWLRQVHGTDVVDADAVPALAPAPEGDASVSAVPGRVCAVLVADCLPVLLADARGRVVAAAHAGWRGLAAGVLARTVAAMRGRLQDPAAQLIAWLGPAIGPAHFEVGEDVLQAMRRALPQAELAFEPVASGRWRADLFALARQALEQSGVRQIHGGGVSTAAPGSGYFSHRRDQGRTGRQAALIWIEGPLLGGAG